MNYLSINAKPLIYFQWKHIFQNEISNFFQTNLYARSIDFNYSYYMICIFPRINMNIFVVIIPCWYLVKYHVQG